MSDIDEAVMVDVARNVIEVYGAGSSKTDVLLASALLRLATRAAKMEAEYDEAIAALSLHTGMRKWREVIASRVAAKVTEVRCDACGGSGERSVDKWTLANTDGSGHFPCEMCAGFGRVTQSTSPTTLAAGDGT